jgi:hypothetical protein
MKGKDTRSVSAAAPTTTAPPVAPEGTAKASQQLMVAPRGREQTVQLATRISPEIADLIDGAANRTGYSKRNIIEQAIQQVWG